MDSVNVTIPDGVTEEDDIIIELTDEILTDLRRERMNPYNSENYSQIVIKFSNKEYLPSDYVVDVKSLENNNDDLAYKIELIKFFAERKDYLKFDNYLYFKNSENKIIMEARMFDYEFSIPYPAPDTTYKDNIIIVNKENEEGKEYTIIIKLKNPEFIEGNNQIYHH